MLLLRPNLALWSGHADTADCRVECSDRSWAACDVSHQPVSPGAATQCTEQNTRSRGSSEVMENELPVVENVQDLAHLSL